MATLNIGAANPLNIPDELLNPYKTQVQAGGDINTVTKSLYDSIANQVATSGPGGSNEEYNAIKNLGFETVNQYHQFISGRQAVTPSYQALQAYLSGTEQPTQYVPGSLEQGKTPQVVAGTAQPTVQTTNPDRASTDVINNPNDPAQLAYQERLAAMGGGMSQADLLLQQAQKMLGGSQATQSTPVSSYTGPSVVDYLNSIGQPSDKNSRARLAQQLGIQNYDFSATKNTELLNSLRSQNAAPAPEVTSPSGDKTTPSSSVDTSVLSNHGLSTPNPTQSPMKSFADTYKEALSISGVSSIKKEFDRVQGEYDKLQNELNDKIIEVNDNPWQSEGIRIREIEKLQSKYEGKTSILTNKLKLYDSLYQQGIDEAKFISEQAYDQYQFDTNTKIKLYELGQKQLEAENSLTQQDFENDLELQRLALDTYKAQNPSSGGSGDLTPAQINSTINQIAGAFDNEQIVKDYNTALGGYETLQKIGVNTKSPADDIAFIYAFAKIMDPNSVVREGEYNTIQKYAQTWADNFGFSAKRVFSNTNFLTPDAKQKMLNALTPKINTIQSQYDNLYSEYQNRINTAQTGGFNTLTDYSQAFPKTNQATIQTQNAPEAIFDSVVGTTNSTAATTQGSGWISNLWNKLF